MKYLKAFVSAVLAGVCISFGGVVYLSVDNKVLGALLFSVGLFAVCSFGLNLFTGKVCYVFERDREYALTLPLIWLGNLAGTLLIGGLVQLTRIAGIGTRAAELCAVKLADGLGSLFLLGVFCNVFIYLAVEGFSSGHHQIGKYLSLFFGVMVFILSGFEHCVADMFYFSAAGLWSVDTLVRILVITAGNAVGGIAFALARSWLGRAA